MDTSRRKQNFYCKSNTKFPRQCTGHIWLVTLQVVCVFCMFGASRTHELPTIRLTDIARYDDIYYVTVPKGNTKTNTENSFAIRGAMLDIVRKYENLRPANATSDLFFWTIRRVNAPLKTSVKANSIRCRIALPNIWHNLMHHLHLHRWMLTIFH